MTVTQIIKDLQDIQYYYRYKQLFDHAGTLTGYHAVLKKAIDYNRIMKDADPQLYRIYVALYIEGNTQSALAVEWFSSESNIKRLNTKLKQYLLEKINSGGKQNEESF